MDGELLNIGYCFEPMVEEIKKRGQTPELQITSLPKLNEDIWGIRKRKLTVIGARTSNGKSAFAVQICYDLALQNKSIVFLSLEMENLECAERLLSHHYNLNNRFLQGGEPPDFYEKGVLLGELLKKKKFFISDCIGKTWKEINDLIEMWHQYGKIPDAIFLDYIQNTKGIGPTKDALDEYIRKFREMAIRYNFAAVICSQVNRTSQENEDKSPQLHQLKGTGFLEEHSDIVLLLHWPYKYGGKDLNHFELHIAKNKMGDTGWRNLKYEPKFCKFSEI